jgi:hypothetical protein
MRAPLTLLSCAALLLASLGLSGCRSRELAPSLPPEPPATVRRPTSDLDAPARAVVEQALKVLDDCVVGQDEIAQLEYDEWDSCLVTPGAAAELDRRAGALIEVAKAAAPAGPAASFVAEASYFRDWVLLVQRTGDSRGSAALYQRLATTWNQWHRETSVAVDPPSLVRSIFGVARDRSGPSVYYIKNSHGTAQRDHDAFVKRGVPLEWRRGPNGPILKVPGPAAGQ